MSLRIRQLIIVVLAVASLAAALVTGRDLFYNLFYLWLALIVIAAVWSWASLRQVRVGRQTRTLFAQVGQSFDERLAVRNDGNWPKLWVEVKDESEFPGHQASQVLTGLGANTQRTWRAHTMARRRGRFRLGPLSITGGDPFGLFQNTRHLPDTNHVVVYPLTWDIPAFPLGLGVTPGGEFLRRRTHYVTANASGVRDYVPGDSYGRIHWKSTARRDRLMVKEFELDPLADMWLFVDGDRGVQAGELPPLPEPGEAWFDHEAPVILPPTTEEYLISAAASLARFFIRQDRSLGFVGYGQARVVVQPDRGERQLSKIMETLSVFRTTGWTPLLDALALEAELLPRGATLIVLTSTWDIRWLSLARGLKRRGVSVAAVAVDALSFGGPRSNAGVVDGLLNLGIPAVSLANGQRLDDNLSRPFP